MVCSAMVLNSIADTNDLIQISGSAAITGNIILTVSLGAFTNPPPSTNVWANGYGGTGNDGGHALAIDSSGNLITVGWFQNSINFGGTVITTGGGQDLFISKHASNGTLTWVKSYGSTGDETATGLAIDSSGNIFVGGYFSGTANFGGTNMTCQGTSDIFLAKYNSSGNHLWSERFGGTNEDYCYGISSDSSGNVAITGTYRRVINFGGTNFNSIFGGDTGYIAKFNGSAVHQWSQSFAGGNANYGRAVAFDSSGNVLLTGSFINYIDFGGGHVNAPTTSTQNIFISKLSSAGAYTWAVGHGDLNTIRSFCISVDSSDDLAISGYFHTATDLGGGTITGTAVFTDGFVAKYLGSNGSYVWAQKMIGTLECVPNAISFDSSKNVLSTGYFDGTCNFGGAPLVSRNGSYDVYVMKNTSGGTPVWQQSFGGVSTDQGYGISTASDGYVGVCGAFSSTTGTFAGGQILTSAGSYDIFIQRMAP